MKQPPKPFAIEIKRSRRPPTSASPMDLFGKDSSALNGASAGFFSRRETASNPASNPARTSEFAVPAFLQTDRAAHRSSADQLSTEAAQVFAPRPAQSSPTSLADETHASEARQPRILPSLVPPDTAALDAIAETGARPRAVRQSRALEASTRKPRGAAKTDRTEKIKAAGKRRAGDGGAAGAADIASDRKPAAAWGAAPAPASPAPLPAQNAAEGNGAHTNGNWRGARPRITRRGREDAAALPPGQHWKRRLNPRAW
jgi:hypothetical protein